MLASYLNFFGTPGFNKTNAPDKEDLAILLVGTLNFTINLSNGQLKKLFVLIYRRNILKEIAEA